MRMAGNARRVGGAASIIAALLLTSAASADPLARTVARADAPRSELSLMRSTDVPGGGLIQRYSQRVGGLPVLDAEVVAVAVPGNGSELISDSTIEGVKAPDTSGAISEAAAIDGASAVIGLERLRSKASAKLGIDRATGALVWRVSLPAWKPLGDFEVTIDANTREQVRVRDLAMNATGTARIFNPNPVVTQDGYDGLKDKNDKDSSLLTALRVPVTLERLSGSKGCLEGQYVDARLGTKGKKVCSDGADFTAATRSQGNFEAVMAYFHIDRERAYVDSLGLSQALRTKPQKVYANAIPDDNSMYSSGDHSLIFGTGGIDDLEDADVAAHEYGHSLQDQAAPGSLNSGREGATLAEGFGDYMAAAMSALTTGGSKWDACIFDWDGIPYSPTGTCGRTADSNKNVEKAEKQCANEIHCVGEVYSSMLLDLREALGNDTAGNSVMDRVVLEANFMGSKKTNYKSTGKALLAADDLLYAGAHKPTIQAALTDRRFCGKTC
jgi:Zn-dependent metalloprotease